MNISAEKPVKIPSSVIELMQKCITNHSFYKSQFNRAKDEKISKWFSDISEAFSAEITPELVYTTSVRNHLDTYEPIRCKTCNKLLSVRTVRENREYCSSSCAAKSSDTQSKRKESFLKKYGSTSHFHSKETQDKIKKTLLERYGVDNAAKSKEILDKTKQHLRDKYGVENVFQIEAVKQKITPAIRKTQHKKNFSNFLEVLKRRNVELLSDQEDYLNLKPITLRCLTCQTEWTTSSLGSAVYISTCPKCAESYTVSKPEKSVVQYIKSIYSGQIIENSRSITKPLELDIYIPEKKLAIEFNGSYWHSENAGASKDKHIYKTKACNKLGIRLIHIFEYEWFNNQDLIKALIRSALGIFSKRIYARQCQARVIDSSTYTKFLQEYHLQGSVNSSIRYGLFCKDELVSVIGFGKSRFKKNEVELHRYCVKSDCLVIGGFSKLIKHACKESHTRSFVSYIDLAHFDGRGYKKIGFEKVSLTKPSYVYTDLKGTVLSRLQCQKHKLAKLLGKGFSDQLTEIQNMAVNGYMKIYDAGNLKVVYNYQ